MKKIKNTKGFTLMEMLIVVAIIAILIAIAIPTFTAQLEKAREAADIANIRSAYAEAMANYLSGEFNEDNKTAASKETVAMTQTVKGWKYIDFPEYLGPKTACEPTKGDKVKVTVKDDKDLGTKVELSISTGSTPAGGAAAGGGANAGSGADKVG